MKKNKIIVGCLVAIFSLQLTFSQDDCVSGNPEWPYIIGPSQSEVIANYADYEYSASVTSVIHVDGAQVASSGDWLAAFIDGELRGIAPAAEIPPQFGNGFGFNMMVYSNESPDGPITFQYYDSQTNAVYALAETLDFASDDSNGNLVVPIVFTYNPGSGPSNTLGCTDASACNYDDSATSDDGSCSYAEENHDCDGNCTADVDCAGECAGSAVEDCAGVCNGTAVIDCAGDCNGEAKFDCNNVCNGTSVLDCSGICN